MKNIKLSDEARKQIINLHLKETRICDISRVLGVKRQTVAYTIKQYTSNHQSNICKRGRKNKLTEEQICHIQKLVDEKVDITLKELKDSVQRTFGITISMSCINNYLKKLHYTFKSIQIIPEKRNTNSTLVERKKYADQFYDLLINFSDGKIFFIDEVGFNFSLRSKKGRLMNLLFFILHIFIGL